jgi:hypothetical protein
MNTPLLISLAFSVFVGLVLSGAIRISIRHAGKWLWGVALQLEPCGCKHVDVLAFRYVVAFHFGRCREDIPE